LENLKKNVLDLGLPDRAVVPFLCALQGMEDGTITRCPSQYKANKLK